MPDWQRRLEEPPAHDLNLPGLAGGHNTGRQLLEAMIGDLHWHAAAIRAGLLPQIGSAWELVELEELLAIGGDIVGDHSIELPKDSTQPVQWSIRESWSVVFRSHWTLRETMVFGAFVLHWHARAISDLVLPTLKLTDAVQLAQSLVIAEQVVDWASKRADDMSECGTVAKPTKLQEQAWTLAARLWMEWPRDKKFGELLDCEEVDSVRQRVGTALAAGPKVAA